MMNVPMMKVSALWDKLLSEYVAAEIDRREAAQRAQDTMKPNSERSDYQREQDRLEAHVKMHFYVGHISQIKRLSDAFGLDTEKLTVQALEQIEQNKEGYTHAARVSDYGSMGHLS